MTKIRDSYKFNPLVYPLCKENISRINGFHCSVQSLDYYLKEHAFEDLENGNGVTYLVVDKDLNTLVAYYTLCSSAIFINQRLKSEMSSSVYVSMFAVAKEYQDILYYTDASRTTIKSVSDNALEELIGTVFDMSQHSLGIKYISLHAITNVTSFYERNGFIKVSEDVLPTEMDIDVDASNCEPMVMSLFY